MIYMKSLKKLHKLNLLLQAISFTMILCLAYYLLKVFPNQIKYNEETNVIGGLVANFSVALVVGIVIVILAIICFILLLILLMCIIIDRTSMRCLKDEYNPSYHKRYMTPQIVYTVLMVLISATPLVLLGQAVFKNAYGIIIFILEIITISFSVTLLVLKIMKLNKIKFINKESEVNIG